MSYLSKHTTAKGFTLVELMIVIAVIAILAAIAVPAYHDYLIRAKVIELVQVASNAKTAVAEYRISQGHFPSNNAMAGIPPTRSQYVDSLTVGDEGTITATGNTTNLGIENTLSITLTPHFADGMISWSCSSNGATQYAPARCRG